eukprot:13914775-Ditylum_brightwellii.AAC.1
MKNVQMEMSSSDEPSINDYQPGGTMVGARGKHMGRILEAESNMHRLGRWSYVCLTGEGKKIYVVSAYRVAQEENNGTHNTFIQQYQIMRSRGDENPKLRKQLCKDLAIEIKKRKKEGEVLLLTDANSTLNEPEFENFLAEIGLFDILGRCMGWEA